jgi:hypothetical protein
MFSFDQDFKKFYRIFKVLPVISSIIVALSVFFVSFIDATRFIPNWGYGIFGFDSALPVVIVWWLIGFASTILTWFFLTLLISPIVVSTDALVSIDKKTTTISTVDSSVVKEVVTATNVSKIEEVAVETDKSSMELTVEEGESDQLIVSTEINPNNPYSLKQKMYKELVERYAKKEITLEEFHAEKDKIFNDAKSLE